MKTKIKDKSRPRGGRVLGKRGRSPVSSDDESFEESSEEVEAERRRGRPRKKAAAVNGASPPVVQNSVRARRLGGVASLEDANPRGRLLSDDNNNATNNNGTRVRKGEEREQGASGRGRGGSTDKGGDKASTKLKEKEKEKPVELKISREARSLLQYVAPPGPVHESDNDDGMSDTVDPSGRYRKRPIDLQKPLLIVLPNDKSALAKELAALEAEGGEAMWGTPLLKGKPGPKLSSQIYIPPYRDVPTYVKEFNACKRMNSSSSIHPRARDKANSKSSPMISEADLKGKPVGIRYDCDSDDEGFIASLRKSYPSLTESVFPIDVFESMIEQLEREAHLSNFLALGRKEEKDFSVRLGEINDRLMRQFKDLGISGDIQGGGDDAFTLRCGICSKGDSALTPAVMIICDMCGIVVHPQCYAIADKTMTNLSPWSCHRCQDEAISHNFAHNCIVCSKTGGAMMPVYKAIGEVPSTNSSDAIKKNRRKLNTWCHVSCSKGQVGWQVTPNGIVGDKSYVYRAVPPPPDASSRPSDSANVHGGVEDGEGGGNDTKVSLRVSVPIASGIDIMTSVMETQSQGKKFPDNKAEILTLIYEHWIKLREENKVPLLRCFHHFPLLDNWKLSNDMPSSVIQVEMADRQERYTELLVRRRELDRVRQLSDMVRRREKLRRECITTTFTIQDDFFDKIERDNFAEAREVSLDNLKLQSLPPSISADAVDDGAAVVDDQEDHESSIATESDEDDGNYEDGPPTTSSKRSKSGRGSNSKSSSAVKAKKAIPFDGKSSRSDRKGSDDKGKPRSESKDSVSKRK